MRQDPDGVTVHRTATLHLPASATKTGDVQVTLLDWDDSTSRAGFVLATIGVAIPAGSLT